MFTARQRYFTHIICIIGIFWCSCLQANYEYHSRYEWLDYCDLNEGEDTPRNYDDFGEFGNMLREFDRQVDDYDRSIDCDFFVFKWGKKLTKWIKKTAGQLCLRMLGLHKIQKSKNNAYTIARFKRIIDQVCDTGPINELIDGIEKELPPDVPGINSFLAQIKYYHKNKNQRPEGEVDPNKYDQSVDLKILMMTEEELKDVDPNYIWAYLEIGCGVLLCALPFPPAKWLGQNLIYAGMAHFAYTGYINKDEENNNNKSQQIQREIRQYLEDF